MAPDTVTPLGQESKIRLPNVDEVLDLGYAFHASDDEALKGKGSQHYAREIVQRFMALLPRDDTEMAYLSCIQSIALAHGRALTRRKRGWENALERASTQRGAALARIRQARFQNAYLNFAWALVGPITLGLAGYLAARMIGMLLPDEVVAQSGHRLPSILMGAVFLVTGRTLAAWWRDAQRNTIELEYAAHCYEADLAYEVGKQEEHRYYRARLCEAWKQYAREDFPKTASYEMVIEGDIATRQRLEQHRQSFNRSYLWLLRRIARLLRRRS